MNFLKFNPTVFVIGDEYEILAISEKNGLIYLEIDGKIYHEKNSGVLHTERNVEKIRVPQNILDKAKKYTVCYRESIDRKMYFSELGEVQKIDFTFKPLERDEDIRAYHVADVHGEYEKAKSSIEAFGNLDFLLVNGDVTEVSSYDDYYMSCKFLSDVAKGEIPVIFSRGNHDTRGKMAENFEEFFPERDGKFYYTFNLGCLSGIVIDCGEDKRDNHNSDGRLVYNGTNDFEALRKIETNYIKNANLPDGKWKFAISHICPIKPTPNAGDCFDIERETYSVWNKELERMGINCMFSAHIHDFGMHEGEEDNAFVPHNYPVFVASDCNGGHVAGGAIIINKDSMTIAYTDEKETFARYKLGKNAHKTEKIL